MESVKITIIVNGHEKHVEQNVIGYEAMALLAYPGQTVTNQYKITYEGPHNEKGVLMPSQTVTLHNGMRFSVVPTGRS